MKNLSIEEINLHKAVLIAALQKNMITEEAYTEAMNNFRELERIANEEMKSKLNKINKMSNKLNLYATS